MQLCFMMASKGKILFSKKLRLPSKPRHLEELHDLAAIHTIIRTQYWAMRRWGCYVTFFLRRRGAPLSRLVDLTWFGLWR
jgi:hypothetical protein